MKPNQIQNAISEMAKENGLTYNEAAEVFDRNLNTDYVGSSVRQKIFMRFRKEKMKSNSKIWRPLYTRT